MSFDILAARSWGSGVLGNVTNPTNINHYAAVTAVANKNITVTASDLTAFTAGTEILLHISGARNASASAANLGLYKFAKIMSVADNVLTLNVKALTTDPAQYFYQAITVPHYKTLTLSNTIEPPAFDESTGCGGILCFKCSSKLVMSGKINLVDKGLTTATYRPLLNQEENGTLDTDTYAGHENYETAKHFVLNVGDGAAMILAKSIDFEAEARIGNPSGYGVQRCRGAEDSTGTPTNFSNIGGSSILIVANSITDFNAKIISKYRAKTLDTPKGLGRCYIATESRLPADEGLYAYDIIRTPERLNKNTLINGFGSGALGVAKRPAAQQNNYAKVTKISSDGKTFTLTNITGEGEAKFERGALVMIHASFKSGGKYDAVGRFFIANVVGTTANSITLNHSIDEPGISNFNVDKYNFQAIAIPQYTTFTLSGRNLSTPEYNKHGGIFAIAVSDTCDLSDGFIDVRGAGGSKYTLDYVSNARMKNRLPIGAGNGSVFILAKNLKMNTSTRIGADYSGNAFGGNVGGSSANYGGGYSGRADDKSQGGSGQQGGKESNGHNGGFSSNAGNSSNVNVYSGLQGASIFIVAQKIDGLNLDALSTGGCAGTTGHVSNSKYKCVAGNSGGCGYGGGGASLKYINMIETKGTGGGVHGGGAGCSDDDDANYAHGGGSSGFCAIYANEFTNQSADNLEFN